MSSGNSSSFSMLQNQEKKQIPRYEVHFTNKNHPFMSCLQSTRKNSIVWPRDIADDPASLAFEAIKTIIWKLPIAPVVRIVSKYFETTGAIGTIIWKPGYKKLIPSKDEHGLLRAHGRLENIRTLPDEMRNPVILPKSHRLVELLLVHLYGKRTHCGYKSLIYESRKRFWIVRVCHMAKHLTEKCVTDHGKVRISRQMIFWSEIIFLLRYQK